MPYDAGNSNGKINAVTFLKILPHLRDATLGREVAIYMDCDSAHKLKKVLEWMDANGMDYIIGAPSSPDLLVMETWVKPLRDRFKARRSQTI